MKLKKLFRALPGTKINFNEENRTIEFSFSSEKPVDRYFGKEILSHKNGSADLTRLNGGANLLFNHNWDAVLGVVEKAWIAEDQRGYALVRFSKNPKAQEVMNDIKDGILKNVSFGYVVKEMQLTKKIDGADSEYTATSWEPHELSIVTVPADASVGIGRSAENELEHEVKVDLSLFEEKQIQEEIKKEIIMSEKEIVKPIIDTAAIAAEAQSVERARIVEITALGERFGHRDLSKQLIEGGKSVEEARAAFLDKMEIKQKPVTGNESDLGLSEKEVKSYSFVRAIHAMANPSDRAAQEAASFEREVSEAASKKLGRAVKGYHIPHDVLKFSRRDLTVGSASAGGNLVGTNLVASSFIELLRNKMVLGQAGMTMLSGLVGNVALPKQTGGATSYWVAENAAPTEGALTVGQVTMSPKTVGAYVDFSRKLSIQSTPDIEALVRSDLVASMQRKIDLAGFYGLGSSNEPTGLKATSGINAVNFAADAPTYAEIVSMETAVAADNADVGTLYYITNASGRGILKGVEKASSTGQFVWEPGNNVNGYPALISNQVASATAAHDYWFGNFADLVLGLWGGMDILVDPYSGSSAGTVRVTIFQECDFGVRHAESFCYGNNNAI